VTFRGCSVVDEPNNVFCDSLGLDPGQNVGDGFAGNYNCSDRSFFGYPPFQGLCAKFTCNGSGDNSITPSQRGPLTEQCEACFAPPPTSTTTEAPPPDTPFCPREIEDNSVSLGGACCESIDCNGNPISEPDTVSPSEFHLLPYSRSDMSFLYKLTDFTILLLPLSFKDGCVTPSLGGVCNPPSLSFDFLKTVDCSSTCTSDADCASGFTCEDDILVDFCTDATRTNEGNTCVAPPPGPGAYHVFMSYSAFIC